MEQRGQGLLRPFVWAGRKAYLGSHIRLNLIYSIAIKSSFEALFVSTFPVWVDVASINGSFVYS